MDGNSLKKQLPAEPQARSQRKAELIEDAADGNAADDTSSSGDEKVGLAPAPKTYDPDLQRYEYLDVHISALREDTQTRKDLLRQLSTLLKVWLCFVAVIVILDGCNASTANWNWAGKILDQSFNWHFVWGGFKLSDNKLIAVCGTTTLAVVAIMHTVAKYFFAVHQKQPGAGIDSVLIGAKKKKEKEETKDKKEDTDTDSPELVKFGKIIANEILDAIQEKNSGK